MKITVRCGVSDGGKPCRRKLGTIERDTPWFRGGNDYDGLLWEERHYPCPKHGAMQVHDEDLVRRALNPSRRWIVARSVLRMGLSVSASGKLGSWSYAVRGRSCKPLTRHLERRSCHFVSLLRWPDARASLYASQQTASR